MIFGKGICLLRSRINTDKRKNIINGILLIGIILLIIYMQFGRDEKVVNSMVKSGNEYCEQEIIIVANKIAIIDGDNYSKTIIEKVENNNLKNIKFSYDLMNNLQRIKIVVYCNELAYKFNQERIEILYEYEDKTRDWGSCL